MTPNIKQLFPDQDAAGKAAAALQSSGLTAECETVPNGVLVKVGAPFGTGRQAMEIMAGFGPSGQAESMFAQNVALWRSKTPTLSSPSWASAKARAIDPAISLASRRKVRSSAGAPPGSRIDLKIAAASRSKFDLRTVVASVSRIDLKIAAASMSRIDRAIAIASRFKIDRAVAKASAPRIDRAIAVASRSKIDRAVAKASAPCVPSVKGRALRIA